MSEIGDRVTAWVTWGSTDFLEVPGITTVKDKNVPEPYQDM